MSLERFYYYLVVSKKGSKQRNALLAETTAQLAARKLLRK
jgi:hypothetical protein